MVSDALSLIDGSYVCGCFQKAVLIFSCVGAAGGMVAGITGDRDKQDKYQAMHDDGKTAQRSAEADIQKQA